MGERSWPPIGLTWRFSAPKATIFQHPVLTTGTLRMIIWLTKQGKPSCFLRRRLVLIWCYCWLNMKNPSGVIGRQSWRGEPSWMGLVNHGPMCHESRVSLKNKKGYRKTSHRWRGASPKLSRESFGVVSKKECQPEEAANRPELLADNLFFFIIILYIFLFFYF